LIYSIFSQGRIISTVTILAIGLGYYYFYNKIKKMEEAGEEVPPLRRLAVIDALDEAVGRAAETNRPLAIAPPGISGNRSFIAIINLNTITYLASACARVGAPIQVYPGREDIINISRQVLLDAYTAEGKLDELDEDYTLRWIQGKWCGSKDVRTVHALWENNVSSVTWFGTSGCFGQQLGANAPVIGATVITGCNTAHGCMYSTIYGDYASIGEEVFTLAAYFTGHPLHVGAVYAQDYAKYFIIPLTLLTALVLWATGSTWLMDLLKL
jgi:hypothetical protein